MENQLATLTPTNFDQALTFSSQMAAAKLLPSHLQDKPADCLRIVMFAARANMDAFSVADKSSVIHGKLMFEGQLVGALCNTCGKLESSLNYVFNDYQNPREMLLTVKATLKGEEDPRTVKVTYEQACAINKNGQMQKNPEQQMCYIGARIWARRHLPEVTMGVYSADEMDTNNPSPTKTDEPRNVTDTDDASQSEGDTSPRPAAPAKDKGVAGARKAAAATKKAATKKAVAKKAVAKEVATPAKPDPEPVEEDKEAPEQAELVQDELPEVVMKIGEIQSDVVCQVSEAFERDLGKAMGIQAELTGQYSGICYDLNLDNLPIMEAAQESGDSLLFQIKGQESTKQAGALVCVITDVSPMPASEVEVEPAF